MNGLRDLRVVDLSSQIAGPYCSKLLADAGADVIKLEPVGGDPLRGWSATGGDLGGGDGALFRFLNASKRSVIASSGDATFDELVAGADLVIEDLGAGAALDRAALLAANPGLVLLSISPYGLAGPYAGRPATEFTIQAESGSIAGRGVPGQEPFTAGGRVAEWVGGTFAAAAALAALRGARRSGLSEHIDFSLQEAMALASTLFMDLMWSLLGSPPVSGAGQSVETPSIEHSSDGYVGFNTNTAQQISDFLLLIERPEFRETGEFNLAGQRMGRLEEWTEIVNEWTRQHTTEEIVELARLLRIPVAPIGTGRSVLDHEHLIEREIYREDPSGDFRAPVPPYKIDGERPPAPRPAPTLGQHQSQIEAHERLAAKSKGAAPALPLAGIRIIDTTTWWAGPSATHALACLGADVIHVESTSRIDGARTVGGMFATKWENWWEASNFFIAANTNKRGVTLDLASPEGQELLLDLVEGADLLVENFSPRVLDGFGITWEAVHQRNPKCIMVRMPAFGLDGPWRDSVGFAQTMEQMSGLAWLTGHPEDQPRIQRGPCDPLAGMHATFAALVALAERDVSGHGHFVECAMVEGALNVAAEQVVEYTAYGREMERLGNRCYEAAPQGLYACAEHDALEHPRWLALSIAAEEQWQALVDWAGETVGLSDLRAADFQERRERHDEIDAILRPLFADRDRDECLAQLLAAGIPAAALADPRNLHEHPQLRARAFYEEIDHPVVGRHAVSTLPYRFSQLKQWLTRTSPTLGQHNHEVFAEAGRSADEIAALEAQGLIGETPKGV